MSFLLQAATERYELPHPGGQAPFQIYVALPAVAEGTRDVPVLFVLDGDIAFATAAELARLRNFAGMTVPTIVVGVGYGAEYAEFAKLRTADLTPPLSEAGKAALGRMSSFIGDRDGAAEAFLTFLTDVLAPDIVRRYPQASATDHSLYGHSLGGLFTAFALLIRPEAFKTFLPASPSLWWDGFAILERLPAFKQAMAAATRKPRVLVMVGGKEQELPTRVPGGFPMSLEEMQAMVSTARMVDASAEFADSLREAGLPDAGHVVFEGEDHGSVIAAALMRGLSFAVPQPT